MVIIPRLTPTRVNNLPYSEKELVHESRNKLGVHVFLHWYCAEFNNLTTLQQQIIIGNHYIHHNNHNHIHDDDEDDDDDVIFQYPDIARAAFLFWGLLDQRMEQSWKDRATKLNNHAVPGLLVEFPHVRLPDNLENMLVKALCFDFTKLTKFMHHSINRDPRHDVNINKDIKFFGYLYFKLRLQSFRRNISISKVVVNYLFGEGYNQYK